jgi:hypothetical protein
MEDDCIASQGPQRTVALEKKKNCSYVPCIIFVGGSRDGKGWKTLTYTDRMNTLHRNKDT